MIFHLVLLLSIIRIQEGHLNTDRQGLAIKGYDPVTYFLDGPKKGFSQFSCKIDNTIYQFVSDENKQLFVSNPQKYQPQYGGWCAYALGLNPDKVKVDPETYKVIDGKLYLFYNFGKTNTLELWNEDETNLMENANKNWQEIIQHGSKGD